MDLSGTHDLSRQTGRARAHEGGEWPRQEPFAKPPVAADPQHPNGFPPGKNVKMAVIAALGFAQLPSQAPELQLLHRWLDTWSGLGDITVGMARRGYRLSLSHIGPREWWAVFATHPQWTPAGYGVTPMPWTAMQRPTWAAVLRPGVPGGA